MGDEQLAPAYGAASRVTIGRPPEKTNDEAASLESLGCAQEILNPEESPGVAWLYTNNGTPLSRHRPASRCAVPFRFLPQNVKEHAPLSAGASVDHGVDVGTTEEHVKRAADRGCCVSSCCASSFRVVVTGSGKTVYDLVRATDVESAIIVALERNPGMTLLWARPEASVEMHPNPQVWCQDNDTLRRKPASSTQEDKCNQSDALLLQMAPQAEANADQS